MKRQKNLYQQLGNLTNIMKMYQGRIRVNTKNKRKLERFENYYVENIVFIQKMLQNKTYIHGKYNIFLIREPKMRIIMSQNIIDKLINHLVSEYCLKPVFEPILINENVATREEKGTHYGLKMVKRYLNELKGEKVLYALKFDISKYFFNLDHGIIKALIKSRMKDKDAIQLLDQIIDSTDSDYINEKIAKIKQTEIEKIQNSKLSAEHKLERIREVEKLPMYLPGKGCPIGNMSSQIIAIFYLNELDHFIKETLGVKQYVRYMDDGLLISPNKEFLKQCLIKIEEMLIKYHLCLNQKTTIVNVKNGIDFLGFRFYIQNEKVICRVRNKTKKRFKQKMKHLYYLYHHKLISYEDFRQVIQSYKGHLSFGNSARLFKHVTFRYIVMPESLGTAVSIKIPVSNGNITIYQVRDKMKEYEADFLLDSYALQHRMVI